MKAEIIGPKGEYKEDGYVYFSDGYVLINGIVEELKGLRISGHNVRMVQLSYHRFVPTLINHNIPKAKYYLIF